MNPLKQRTPGGGPGNDAKNICVANEREFRQSSDNPQAGCPKCAFYELIIRKSGYKYGLCHFTGVHDPQPGQAGCRFIPGNWENIDEILGLTGKRDEGKLEIPNNVRHGNGLISIPNIDEKIADNTISAILSPAGKYSGGGLNHISRVATSGIREDRRLHVSRGALHPAFLF